MAGIKGRNTKPEIKLRQILHREGFRFRLHCRDMPGRPDIVLKKYRTAIFVHGCFWHRHHGCRYASTPSTRADFWQAKFEANVARDSAVREVLLAAGWRVATIWECALRKPEQVSLATQRLSVWLVPETDTLELGEVEVSAPTGDGEDVGSSS